MSRESIVKVAEAMERQAAILWRRARQLRQLAGEQDDPAESECGGRLISLSEARKRYASVGGSRE